jgi:hypothetical protein
LAVPHAERHDPAVDEEDLLGIRGLSVVPGGVVVDRVVARIESDASVRAGLVVDAEAGAARALLAMAARCPGELRLVVLVFVVTTR